MSSTRAIHTDEARRVLAETLIFWASRTYPARTSRDMVVLFEISEALKAAMRLRLRRAGA